MSVYDCQPCFGCDQHIQCFRIPQPMSSNLVPEVAGGYQCSWLYRPFSTRLGLQAIKPFEAVVFFINAKQ
ncbi:unnamed protein product [Gongylonema pulchrum]|uniref:Uncharacterized protein n=1 Tax=Gongylonema pulchrum TaxID=637853 RepID=A0A183D1Q1_9BILA|nr:unnamed protein product [Gongylonema pulchrum]